MDQITSLILALFLVLRFCGVMLVLESSISFLAIFSRGDFVDGDLGSFSDFLDLFFLIGFLSATVLNSQKTKL